MFLRLRAFLGGGSNERQSTPAAAFPAGSRVPVEWRALCAQLKDRTEALSLVELSTQSGQVSCHTSPDQEATSWTLSPYEARAALRTMLAGSGETAAFLVMLDEPFGESWAIVTEAIRAYAGSALVMASPRKGLTGRSLCQRLVESGVTVAFHGQSPAVGGGLDHEPADGWPAAVVLRGFRPEHAPAAFRVRAIVTAFNEVDIVRPTVQYLIDQGIEVLLVDNWSEDGTVEEVEDLQGERLVIQKFPQHGRSQKFDLTELLRNVELQAACSGADWVIHHDADEIRESPWPDLSLRDAVYTVHAMGWNAIDHTCLEFRPIDDHYPQGRNPRTYFQHFEFAKSKRVNAWRQPPGSTVDLQSSGGHRVDFPGVRIFPGNFFMRHFSIRSQRHGEQKVYRDRQPRYPAAEILKGWHYHYARMKPDQSFLRSPADLLRYDDETFHEMYLFERLARVGFHEAIPASFPGRILMELRRLGLIQPSTLRRLKRTQLAFSGRLK